MATASEQARTLVSRAVIWTGIVLGTALTILAMWNGVRLRVPDLPSIIGAALGTVIVWALFMAAAAVLSELTVRHHRTVLGHGWRHGKRGGAAAAGWSRRAARGAAVRSRPWRTRLITAMRARWAARGVPAAPEPEDLAGGNERICPGCGWAIPAGGTCPACKAGREAGQPEPGTGPAYSWGPADGPSGWPADDPETAHRWAQHMSTGGKPQVVTEYPPGGGPGRTVATYVNGQPVQPSTEGSTMTDPDARPRSRRPGGSAGGGGCSPAWKSLTAETGDFEPEDDGHLMAWMASEVNGMSAYAEAITDVYETAVSRRRPRSGLAWPPCTTMRTPPPRPRRRWPPPGRSSPVHYQEVREFAAAGGLLPHDGRWITGEGE